jgi:hypothetical protein
VLFEELGLYYVGPIDGHDMENLVPILQNLRDSVCPISCTPNSQLSTIAMSTTLNHQPETTNHNP